MKKIFSILISLSLSPTVFCAGFSQSQNQIDNDIIKTVNNDKKNIIEDDFYNNLKKKLTLLDIIDIALKNNPQIRQAWLNVDVAKSSLNIHRSDYFPTLTGEVDYTKHKSKLDTKNSISDKYKTFSPSIKMDYLLFNFGGRTADVLNFKYKLNAIKYDTNKFVQDFIYKVIEAYYNLFLSLENEKAAKEIELSSLETYRAASLKYKIGVVALTDKLQAETEYNQKKLSREKAENALKQSKASLNYLLNISPLFNLDIERTVFDINNDKIQSNIVSLIDKALKNRSDLKSYYETQKSKKAELYSNSVSWLPSIRFTGSYGYVNDLYHKHNPDEKQYNIGLTASMPFFTGGRVYNNVSKTKSELKIIQEQIRDLKRNIEVDVWTAYHNFITARTNFLTSEILLKSSIETEKNIFGRYKNGKSSMLDLLTAQSNLASAKYEHISSQYNLFIARVDLLRSIGNMTIEELASLINSKNTSNIDLSNDINKKEYIDFSEENIIKDNII